MHSTQQARYRRVRGVFRSYLVGLLGLGLVLGVLHLLYEDLNAGGVYWLNLDKERNLPTWYSGSVFFLFGCAAWASYFLERQRTQQNPNCFRLPVLWLGVGLVGIYMSLDEITILHENLLWREVRRASSQLRGPWHYLTQWQILFSPAILLVMAYLVIFFSNRFAASVSARRGALAGIGAWIVALLLEGARGTFKQAAENAYSWEVLVEEELEVFGALLLLAAITSYAIDIALDFSAARESRLRLGSRFLTRRAMMSLSGVVLALSVSAGVVYSLASKQAAVEAPVPTLYKRATRDTSTSP